MVCPEDELAMKIAQNGGILHKTHSAFLAGKMAWESCPKCIHIQNNISRNCHQVVL